MPVCLRVGEQWGIGVDPDRPLHLTANMLFVSWVLWTCQSALLLALILVHGICPASSVHRRRSEELEHY